MFGARFDDVAAGSSFILTDPVSTLTAKTLSDVPVVLDEVSAAAASGHWVAGYVAFDAAPSFDQSLVAHRDRTLPLAWFGVFKGRSPVERLGTKADAGGYSTSRWSPLVERSTYDAAFGSVIDHIGAGDVYQVNLTFPMRAAFSGDPSELYASMVDAQEAGYASHIWHDDVHVASVSPERFFAIDQGRIVTRPMKGTRQRGRWSNEDLALREELATSVKDRAENLMIVDLLRNDLGRIAEFGTVSVDELFAIERYATVWQMTSEISAMLSPEVSLRDVFAALFPCGSVTGAPKSSAMQVIAEVEPHPRGIYCGAIGFVPPGDGTDGASFSVAIRTAVINLGEGVVHYGVGGGITWDSDADGEYDEARAKAMVLTSRPSPTGLIETIRWDGRWYWLDEHIDRLAESADHFGIDVDSATLRSALEALAGLLDAPTRVRVVVNSDGSTSVTTDEAPSRFVTRPGPESDVTTIEIDFDPVDARDPSLYHKVLDRSVYDLRSRRHPSVDDVLLTNGSGNVTETTIGNIVCRFGDRWVTPPVADGLLPGILRGELLGEGFISEESISIEEIRTADAIAVVNSVRGWRAASLSAPA